MNGINLNNNTNFDIDEDNQRLRESFESSLAEYISVVWANNKRAKIDVEQRFLKSLRQRKGEYDPEKLSLIKMTEGSEIFYRATSIKCRAANAWLVDAYHQKRWMIEPTPVPEISFGKIEAIKKDVLLAVYQIAMMYRGETGMQVSPEEFDEVSSKYYWMMLEAEEIKIKEEAKKSADRMSKLINDQLLQGSWEGAFSKVRKDVIEFGTGIMKGPVPKIKKVSSWVKKENKWVIEEVDKIQLEYERVSPFDIYPEDDATGIQDGNFIERMFMRPKDLYDMKDSYGYNAGYIVRALEHKNKPENLPPDRERLKVEGRFDMFHSSDRIEVINFWGNIKGSMLTEWGMDDAGIDGDDYYNVNAWLVNGYVVKLVRIKGDERPYSKAVFDEIPGSFWGESLPEHLRDDQDMCNSNARAIQNNEAWSSVPMAELAIDRLVPGSITNKIWAGRVFQSTRKNMSDGRVVEFYQPPSILMELLQVFREFSKSMDDKSGIPAYAHGDPKVGGLGNTSSGLSMFLTMAGKLMNALAVHIDRNIVCPVIERTYNYNMRYSDDESVKGDSRVKILDIAAVVIKEQDEVRQAELLRDTNNPVDVQIFGMNGRKELLKSRIKSMQNIDVEKVLPDNPILPMLEHAGSVPAKKPETLDVAGNKAGGKGSNKFLSVSQRGTA